MGLQEYAGVEFEDEKYIPEATVKERGGIYAFLLAKRIVKNQTQANILLIVASILLMSLAYILSQTFFNNQSNAPVLTEEDSYRAGNPNEIDNTLR